MGEKRQQLYSKVETLFLQINKKNKKNTLVIIIINMIEIMYNDQYNNNALVKK